MPRIDLGLALRDTTPAHSAGVGRLNGIKGVRLAIVLYLGWADGARGTRDVFENVSASLSAVRRELRELSQLSADPSDVGLANGLGGPLLNVSQAKRG